MLRSSNGDLFRKLDTGWESVLWMAFGVAVREACRASAEACLAAAAAAAAVLAHCIRALGSVQRVYSKMCYSVLTLVCE